MNKNRPRLFERLPVTYSAIGDFSDSRFLKVRVKVMHTGLNLNNSFFSGDAVSKAEGSCKNIPLLAYTRKVDGSDQADFAGHEYEIKFTDNGMEYVYLGRPIGMIPETNNYTFEQDEDGRSFVNVDGYIWTDYANEALKVIERDQMKKVSMEILVDDYEWTDTHVNINDYRYTGIALLGDDVNEAMIGAKMEVMQFSTSKINEMAIELNAALVSMFEVTNKTEEATEETTKETAENFEADEAKEVESDEAKVDEVDEAKADEAEKTDEDDSDMFQADETNADQEPEKNFSESDENSKTEEDFSTNLMSEQEVIDLKASYADLEVKFKALQADYELLITFKQQKEAELELAKQAKIDELFAQFEDVTKYEGFEKIKALASSEEIEMLETRLFALRGKYATVDNLAGKIALTTNFADEPEFLSLVRKHIKN